jgi:hypothetical protein
MKAAILGGALAFALWGGSALAKGETMTKNCPPSGTQTSEGTSTSAGQGTSTSADCPDTAHDPALGGSGSSISTSESSTGQRSSEIGTGATGTATGTNSSERTETTVVSVQPMDDVDDDERRKSDARGVTVLLGGGVETYTGNLAPQLNAGPGWGVGVALKPVGALGIELGYSGAINSVQGSSGFTSTSTTTVPNEIDNEADLVRNGGSAIATVGLGPAPFQPYLLGGIGVDWYNVRNAEAGRFRDDTVGSVPLGLGFRTHVGDFTADLRGVYGVLFNQGFAPGEGNTNLAEIGSETPTGRFGAQLRLGATF